MIMKSISGIALMFMLLSTILFTPMRHVAAQQGNGIRVGGLFRDKRAGMNNRRPGGNGGNNQGGRGGIGGNGRPDDGVVATSSCNRGMGNIPCLVDAIRAGEIQRTVEQTPVGSVTKTWSTAEDPSTHARWLEEHVAQMWARMGGNGVRNWDPIFRALREHHDEMTLECSRTSDGVSCEHSIKDGASACALALIRSHSALVSSFVADPANLQKRNLIPPECE